MEMWKSLTSASVHGKYLLRPASLAKVTREAADRIGELRERVERRDPRRTFSDNHAMQGP